MIRHGPSARHRASARVGPALPERVHADAVTAPDAAEPLRPVAGQVAEDPSAVVRRTGPQSTDLVGADHVAQGQGGLDPDAVREGRVVTRRVQVPVEGVVSHEPGRRHTVGQHAVDLDGQEVALEGPDAPQLGPDALHQGQLGVVAVETAREGERVEQGRQLGPGRELVTTGSTRPGTGATTTTSTTTPLAAGRPASTTAGLLGALRGRLGPIWRARWRVLGMAVIGVAGTQVFYFAAVVRIPVGTAILVEYLAPLLLVGVA